MANAVGRCARDTAAARVGEGEGRKGMEGGSDGVQWHTQGVSSFTGHDPVVSSHSIHFFGELLGIAMTFSYISYIN